MVMVGEQLRYNTGLDINARCETRRVASVAIGPLRKEGPWSDRVFDFVVESLRNQFLETFFLLSQVADWHGKDQRCSWRWHGQGFHGRILNPSCTYWCQWQ